MLIPNRVGQFHKVSFEQFKKDMLENFFCLNDYDMQDAYYSLNIPTRATSGSAGYDFYSPISITLEAGCTAKFPTGIRVEINEGWWLGCLPRSSLGFKYRLQLDNTMGVVDSDYFYSDNEGHIWAKITNNSDKALEIKAGDRFMQGIFIPYGITYSDCANGKRNGGFGSTNIPSVIETGSLNS